MINFIKKLLKKARKPRKKIQKKVLEKIELAQKFKRKKYIGCK